MPRYGQVDHEYGAQLATCPEDADGPVYMLNLMKYRAEAEYGDGSHGLSGRDADDRYAPVDVLTAIGAQVCLHGDVVVSSEDWDRVGVVRYPTRRSFIEMQSRADFREKHVHKEAGMDHTIVMGTVPTDGPLPRAKPDCWLLEVWNGSAPPAIVDGESFRFTVEGTILGDGRTWTEARYTQIPRGATVDVSCGDSSYEVLVVQPSVERWT